MQTAKMMSITSTGGEVGMTPKPYTAPETKSNAAESDAKQYGSEENDKFKNSCHSQRKRPSGFPSIVSPSVKENFR